MILNDIGAHPDAPHHYMSMHKPAGWSEEDCGTLTVRRVGATGDVLHEPAVRLVRDDLPSGEAIYPCFMSQWEPTEDERDRLLQLLLDGEPIHFRSLIVGNGLPPQSLWLRAEGEV